MYDPYDITKGVVIEFDNGDIAVERESLNINSFGGNYRAQHTVLEGETIANIAHQYYGDSGYWTIIADINSIYEPLNDLVPGMVLIIP